MTDFKNIGSKLQTLAECLVVLSIVGGFIALIVSLDSGDGGILIGVIVCILVVWLSCMIIYGFGKMIEMVERIERNTSKSKEEKALEEKIKKLDCWKEQELITEKEYEVMKNKLLSPDDMLSTIKKKYEAGEITEQQYKEMRMKILNNLLR